MGRFISTGRVHFTGRYVTGHVEAGQPNRQMVDEGARAMQRGADDQCVSFGLRYLHEM
jgi:hypothetical protein